MMTEISSRVKVFLCSTHIECTRNLHETTRLQCYFQKNGIPVVPRVDDATTVVITTCGFDDIKENYAMRTIRKYVEGYLDKEVVICGCLPSIHGALEQEFPRAIVLHSIMGNAIDRLFLAKVPMRDIQVNRLSREMITSGDVGKPLEPQTHFHIQIGEGCLSHCTYCVYKKIRKGVWSKPLEKVVEEFKKCVAQGAERVVFLGEDCASYGVDINSSLPQLLRECYRWRDNGVKISVAFMEPARLLKIYQDFDRCLFEDFILDICIPLQSCSPAVLKAMNRRYDIREVLKIVAAIRRINPRIRLITHIIYGFPGETREEFELSFDLVRYFDEIQYFCYMDRPGSSSSRMKNKTPVKEMLWRTSVIQKEQNKRIRAGFRCPIRLAYTNKELFWILGVKN